MIEKDLRLGRIFSMQEFYRDFRTNYPLKEVVSDIMV